MVIKNKEGGTYKLRSPNPIMKEQNLWDNKFILHNLKSRRKTVSKEQPVPVQSPPQEEPDEIQAAADVFHCLPAIVNKHRDTLYNETYSSVKYDKPFTFEAVILENSDLTIRFWTNAETAERITEGSVLYPRITDKRWWKVTQRVLSWSGGWVIAAVPSDFQPAFI